MVPGTNDVICNGPKVIGVRQTESLQFRQQHQQLLRAHSYSGPSALDIIPPPQDFLGAGDLPANPLNGGSGGGGNGVIGENDFQLPETNRVNFKPRKEAVAMVKLNSLDNPSKAFN